MFQSINKIIKHKTVKNQRTEQSETKESTIIHQAPHLTTPQSKKKNF